MLTPEEQKFSEDAVGWIKANRKALIARFCNPTECTSDPNPITLFMAGSPGAGKTEVSKQLIRRFTQKPVRIDADEIRALCPGYAGANAHVFQEAATKGVHILYDYALKHGINVILDGTFAYKSSLENIERSLSRGRKVEIYFVYQDPIQAWEFTKKREAIEHRNVLKEVFIKSSLLARENVHAAKAKFGNKIDLNLLIKDFEKDFDQLELNIERIDPYLRQVYSEEELVALIS